MCYVNGVVYEPTATSPGHHWDYSVEFKISTVHYKSFEVEKFRGFTD